MSTSDRLQPFEQVLPQDDQNADVIPLHNIDPSHLEVKDNELVEPTASNFLPRLGNTLRTLWNEQVHGDHRIKKLGAFVVGGATQAFDRGRAMVFVLPIVFDETMEQSFEEGWNGYQTAGAAGLAVGGIFGAWGWAVGRSFHGSINAFPETTEKVVENHPVAVGVISKAIDGFPSKEELEADNPVKPEEGYDVGPYDTRKTFLGKVGLALTRGPKTAFLFGTTAHVGVAKVSEHSDESNARRRRAVTAEAGVTLGGVAAGLSTMLTHDMFGIAEEVRDAITNKSYLGGATIALVAAAAIGNYVSRRGYANEEEVVVPAEAVDHDLQLDAKLVANPES